MGIGKIRLLIFQLHNYSAKDVFFRVAIPIGENTEHLINILHCLCTFIYTYVYRKQNANKKPYFPCVPLRSHIDGGMPNSVFPKGLRASVFIPGCAWNCCRLWMEDCCGTKDENMLDCYAAAAPTMYGCILACIYFHLIKNIFQQYLRIIYLWTCNTYTHICIRCAIQTHTVQIHTPPPTLLHIPQ